MKTIFKIGSKSHTLKYQRKMSEGEVKKMKSFVTSKGVKIEKTGNFKPGQMGGGQCLCKTK